MKIKLGISPCPNDTFAFDALINNRIQHPFDINLHFADIKELNLLAKTGDLDVVKLSYNALSFLLGNYNLLSSGSALGNGVGPLLISKSKHIDWDKNPKIAIPGIQTTANFLMKFAYPKLQNKKVYLFHEIENAVIDEEVDLGVIIHENRFTYQEKGLFKIKDLGVYWEEKTGFAIPLGGIAINKNIDIHAQTQFQEALKSSIIYAFKHPEVSRDFIKSHAQEMNDHIIEQHIQLYVNDYSIDLGKKGRATIEYFIKSANPLNNNQLNIIA